MGVLERTARCRGWVERRQPEFLAAAVRAVTDEFYVDVDDFEGLRRPVRHGVVRRVPHAVAAQAAAVRVVFNGRIVPC